MRRILKIAKAELFTLFYSPVAWLILVAFTVQVGLKFTGLMADFVYLVLLSDCVVDSGDIYLSSEYGVHERLGG